MSSSQKRPGARETSPASNNAHLLESGEYSDLVIECGSSSFKVHKSVVCPQCSFFKAACENGFKESFEGVIRLVEDEPASVFRMLEFMYTGSYNSKDERYEPGERNEETGNDINTFSLFRVRTISTKKVKTETPERKAMRSVPETPRSELQNHFGVQRLATKYDIKPLKSFCSDKIRSCMKTSTEIEVIDALEIAHEQGHATNEGEAYDEVIRRLWYCPEEFYPRGVVEYDEFSELMEKYPEISAKNAWRVWEHIGRLRRDATKMSKLILMLPEDLCKDFACSMCDESSKSFDSTGFFFSCEHCHDPTKTNEGSE